jgi:transposase InsO family protein
LISDTYRPDNSIIVTLNNDLYVPGLTKRLLSTHGTPAEDGYPYALIAQYWTYTTEIVIASIEVPPVAGTTGTDQVYQVSERQNGYIKLPKRTRVQQRLLHRRLGHRPISTLLLAQRDNLWSDIEIVPEQDEFCETCKITTAQKANRGSQPLEDLEPVVPGTFVMVDILTNPSTKSITRNTYFQYYLAVTDVASSFFVPIKVQDKKARKVFNAIHEWATCYGPSATFNISQLNRIHGDYDTVFRSEEIIQLARQSNINISYAAPRHQEQNGICEASWKNVGKHSLS